MQVNLHFLLVKGPTKSMHSDIWTISRFTTRRNHVMGILKQTDSRHLSFWMAPMLILLLRALYGVTTTWAVVRLTSLEQEKGKLKWSPGSGHSTILYITFWKTYHCHNMHSTQAFSPQGSVHLRAVSTAVWIRLWVTKQYYQYNTLQRSTS